MSIVFYLLALAACIVSALIGAFVMRVLQERKREIFEQEDPRDTQIRELQAQISLITKDTKRDRQTALESKEHVDLAHERIVELTRRIETLGTEAEAETTRLKDAREEIELLQDKLSLANHQNDRLRVRNQELEVEMSVTNESNMLEELDCGLNDATETQEQEDLEQEDEAEDIFTAEVSDSSPSLIHSLTEEIDRWKRHCQVLGGELKHQREREPESGLNGSGEMPAIDELTDIHGIGTTLARKLHKAGIWTFADLLQLEGEKLEMAQLMIPDLERRMTRDNWLEQARHLQAGQQTETTSTESAQH